MLEELYADMLARREQQIRFPLDEGSKASLGVPTIIGPGSSALTQSVAVPSTPTNINVPKAYQDTFILNSGGVNYEVPFIAIV